MTQEVTEVTQRAFAALYRLGGKCGATDLIAVPRNKDTPREPAREPRARRMMKQEEVLQIVPVSASTLWRMEKDGLFPKGDWISYNTKVWYEDEVIVWQNSTSGRSRGRRPRKPRG
jgi:predicted DNA-binding transcriptional regulator AlpA